MTNERVAVGFIKLMQARFIFIANSVVTVGYALAFFAATTPLLAIYGIEPNPAAAYMARWFGVGLLAMGLTGA